MDHLFWLENPVSLFGDMKIMPNNSMTTEERMNCITRLIILIFLVIHLFDYKYYFLLFLLLFFIIYKRI